MSDQVDLRELLTDRIRVLFRHAREHAAELMEKGAHPLPVRLLVWTEGGEEAPRQYDGVDAVAQGRAEWRSLTGSCERLALIHVQPERSGEDAILLELFDVESPYQVDLGIPFRMAEGKCVFQGPVVTGFQAIPSLS